jgi:hypothetical protein
MKNESKRFDVATAPNITNPMPAEVPDQIAESFKPNHLTRITCNATGCRRTFSPL